MENVLQSQRLIIQPLDASHVKVVLAFLKKNKSFFRVFQPTLNKDYYTELYQQKLLQSDVDGWNNKTKYSFYLFHHLDHERSQILGTVTLSNVVRGPLQSCFVGYKVDQQFQSKGIATEGIAHVIQFAFKRLKLHRIEANIMPDNLASIKVIEKLGFKKEGFSEQYLKINGKWEDHLRFALINKDF